MRVLLAAILLLAIIPGVMSACQQSGTLQVCTSEVDGQLQVTATDNRDPEPLPQHMSCGDDAVSTKQILFDIDADWTTITGAQTYWEGSECEPDESEGERLFEGGLNDMVWDLPLPPDGATLTITAYAYDRQEYSEYQPLPIDECRGPCVDASLNAPETLQIAFEESPTPTPTCNDNIQNGDETGVDCGGSCAACANRNFQTVGNTNVITTDDDIHMCGKWDLNDLSIPTDPVTVHDFCKEVETYYYNYTCSRYNTSWWWMRTDFGVPVILKGTADHQSLVDNYGANPEWQAIGCADGSMSEAIIKYSPPPTLKQGYCPRQQCYTGNDQSSCKPAGTESSNGYLCEINDGDAAWTSPTSRLAKWMLSEASGEWVLNCGPSRTSINKQESRAQRGYCELALMSGGNVNEIIIGVATASTNDDEIKAQAALAHPEFNASGPDLESQPWVRISPDEDMIYFTTADTLGAGDPVTWLWTKVRELFQGKTDLKTNAAEYLFAMGSGNTINTQHSAEYTTDDCRSGLKMLPQDECFTPQEWRAVMQEARG